MFSNPRNDKIKKSLILACLFMCVAIVLYSIINDKNKDSQSFYVYDSSVNNKNKENHSSKPTEKPFKKQDEHIEENNKDNNGSNAVHTPKINLDEKLAAEAKVAEVLGANILVCDVAKRVPEMVTNDGWVSAKVLFSTNEIDFPNPVNIVIYEGIMAVPTPKDVTKSIVIIPGFGRLFVSWSSKNSLPDYNYCDVVDTVSKSAYVHGKVVDMRGNPVPYSAIKGCGVEALAEFDGSFFLEIQAVTCNLSAAMNSYSPYGEAYQVRPITGQDLIDVVLVSPETRTNMSNEDVRVAAIDNLRLQNEMRARIIVLISETENESERQLLVQQLAELENQMQLVREVLKSGN